jgi:hypothetical protein
VAAAGPSDARELRLHPGRHEFVDVSNCCKGSSADDAAGPILPSASAARKCHHGQSFALRKGSNFGTAALAAGPNCPRLVRAARRTSCSSSVNASKRAGTVSLALLAISPSALAAKVRAGTSSLNALTRSGTAVAAAGPRSPSEDAADERT